MAVTKLGFALALHPWIVQAGCYPHVLTTCIRTHVFPIHKVRKYLNLKGQLAYIVIHSNIKISRSRGVFTDRSIRHHRLISICCEGYTAVILTDSIQNSFINWSLNIPSCPINTWASADRIQFITCFQNTEMVPSCRMLQRFEDGTTEHCHLFVDSGTDW